MSEPTPDLRSTRLVSQYLLPEHLQFYPDAFWATMRVSLETVVSGLREDAEQRGLVPDLSTFTLTVAAPPRSRPGDKPAIPPHGGHTITTTITVSPPKEHTP